MGVVGDGVGEGGWCWAEVRVNCLPVSKKKAAFRQTCCPGRVGSCQFARLQSTIPAANPTPRPHQQGRAGQEHDGLAMTMTELSSCYFPHEYVIY